MRAVDPSIKVIGPATANIDTGQNPEYVPDLMYNAIYKPDVISYHGYGGTILKVISTCLMATPV
jgi:hypothetical protein